jgi:hypothetical protein
MLHLDFWAKLGSSALCQTIFVVAATDSALQPMETSKSAFLATVKFLSGKNSQQMQNFN